MINILLPLKLFLSKYYLNFCTLCRSLVHKLLCTFSECIAIQILSIHVVVCLDIFGHAKKETTNEIISGGIFDGGLENGSYSPYIFANVCLEFLQELLFIKVYLEMRLFSCLCFVLFFFSNTFKNYKK